MLKSKAIISSDLVYYFSMKIRFFNFAHRFIFYISYIFNREGKTLLLFPLTELSPLCLFTYFWISNCSRCSELKFVEFGSSFTGVVELESAISFSCLILSRINCVAAFIELGTMSPEPTEAPLLTTIFPILLSPTVVFKFSELFFGLPDLLFGLCVCSWWSLRLRWLRKFLLQASHSYISSLIRMLCFK